MVRTYELHPVASRHHPIRLLRKASFRTPDWRYPREFSSRTSLEQRRWCTQRNFPCLRAGLAAKSVWASSCWLDGPERGKRLSWRGLPCWGEGSSPVGTMEKYNGKWTTDRTPNDQSMLSIVIHESDQFVGHTLASKNFWKILQCCIIAVTWGHCWKVKLHKKVTTYDTNYLQVMDQGCRSDILARLEHRTWPWIGRRNGMGLIYFHFFIHSST